MGAGYTIRACGPDDLDAWWKLRLKSLKDHPDAFGSDYELSLRRGPTYAERGYFDGGANRLFAAFSSDDELTAQTATYAESGKRGHIAHVVSVYTHPGHRGQGIASRLVQAAIDHLRSFPEITSIRISVNANNAAAIHTYMKLGFEIWGEEPDALRTPDGVLHAELHMVLSPDARGSDHR